MLRWGFLALAMTAVTLTVTGTGCSAKKSEKTGEKSASKSDGHDDHKHADAHGKHAHAGEIKENLAKLADADRVSAEKQEMCPVTGDHLGSMGVPIKLTLKGQDVWICCKGCKDAVEKNPEKYLAKLKK